MSLTEEQVSEIKKQLIDNITKSFPEERKQFAIDQINSMSAEELEEFLKKNNLSINEQGQGCIFCAIISGKMASYKVAENSKATAVLEINPMSKGHTLIIPKEHSERLNESDLESITKEVSEKIEAHLKPKDILKERTSLFGHEILNLIPRDDGESLSSERKTAKPEELKEVQELLEKPIEKKEESPKKPEKKIKRKYTKSGKPRKPRKPRVLKDTPGVPRRIP